MNPLQAASVNTPPPVRSKRPRETCYSLPQTLVDPKISPDGKRRAIARYIEDQGLVWGVKGMSVKLNPPPRYGDAPVQEPFPASLLPLATESVIRDAAERQVRIRAAHLTFWDRLDTIPEAENQPVE